MSSESSLRADIVEVGRRLYARAYTASNDGNISVRLDDGFLITPTDACLGFLDPAQLAHVTFDAPSLQATDVVGRPFPREAGRAVFPYSFIDSQRVRWMS